MPQPPFAIGSRATFHRRLVSLIDAASANGVDVSGTYLVENLQTDECYEVEVVPLDPNHG